MQREVRIRGRRIPRRASRRHTQVERRRQKSDKERSEGLELMEVPWNRIVPLASLPSFRARPPAEQRQSEVVFTDNPMMRGTPRGKDNGS